MAVSIVLAGIARRAIIVVFCMAVCGTVSGQAVPSWPIDPLMTANDESRILDLLGQRITPPAYGMPLRSLVETLPTEIPIAINSRALDEIGMSADEPIEVRLNRPAPLMVHLMSVLQTMDLTILLRNNALTITTNEQLEQCYPVRVYDVTALTNQSRRYQVQQLREVIEVSIAPDSWEQLGGPGVIATRLSLNQTCLVIANSTVNHLQIDTLLNRLAGDRNYRPISRMDSQGRSREMDQPISELRTEVKKLVNFANP
ncbi:hypothetical protein [Rubripirellula obstinata]|nr:hypothetical protein [Rubripirellula obstinata]